MIAENVKFPFVPDFAGPELATGEVGLSEQLVHEEIARLPDSFRKPLVLCCLQGLSYDLAAQQLGVNHSTCADVLSAPKTASFAIATTRYSRSCRHPVHRSASLLVAPPAHCH